MPAYPVHTVFSHIALHALAQSRHPLAPSALRHANVFRLAGIAGCDINCMPYHVCRGCGAPYRHPQKHGRRCLVCGADDALDDFAFDVSDGRRLMRRDIERELYGNTHLVLYQQYRGYGVPPGTPQGPAEQPFPRQVVDHLTSCLRDAERVAGAADEVECYLAFVLGWFSHVVSDAIFKGVYPHAAKVDFFGQQYGMQMLPAAETLTMTDIAHDWGVNWPSFHRELLAVGPDGGALRHLAMGDPPDTYDPRWWTPAHGRPDPAIGRVIDALRPINPPWFHRLYTTPDYTAPTPLLDARPPSTRATWRFGSEDIDLGQLRRYAMCTGWYDALITAVDLYLRVVADAARAAGYTGVAAGEGAGSDAAGPLPWSEWRRAVRDATGAAEQLSSEWGSRLQVDPAAITALDAWPQPVRVVMGPNPTELQLRIAGAVRSRLGADQAGDDERLALRRVIIGTPAYCPDTRPFLSDAELLRLKYDAGLSGLVRLHGDCKVLLIAGFSEFGEHQLDQWLDAARPPGLAPS